MDTGKHVGGGSSLQAFLESAKEALGEPAVEAIIKALKPALDDAKLSKLGSLAVSEESHIALGSRTVLSVKPKEFFGEKIDNRELPGDPEGYYTFSIEPKIEGLGVFVGRRHGKDNRARIVLDGVTEEGTTFVVTAFVEAPKDKVRCPAPVREPCAVPTPSLRRTSFSRLSTRTSSGKPHVADATTTKRKR